MTTRRGFLKSASGMALAGSALQPFLTWATADSSLTVPGKEGLIVRSYRFLDLETPVEYFSTWLTPAEHFFVRNHMHEPSTLDPADWKLSIGGEVDQPYTLTLAELSRLETHPVVNTLECAGNGRAFQSPRVGQGPHSAKISRTERSRGAAGNAAVSFPPFEARTNLTK